MSEPFEKSPIDLRLAEDAYLTYALGVAMLLDEKNEVNMAVNGSLLDTGNVGVIVLQAEVFMLDGLRQVIKFAHPPEMRGYLAGLDKLHAEALPHMIAAVDRVLDSRTEELMRLHAGYDFRQPRVMNSESVYNNICHSNLDRLPTRRLLDGFVSDPAFDHVLEGRKLTHAGKYPISA